MTTPDRERLSELASLQALGVLSVEERAQLVQAAQQDAELRAEIRGFETTATALAAAVPQVDPPPGLRSRILSSVGGRVVPMERAAGGRAAAPERAAGLAGGGSGPVRGDGSGRSGRCSCAERSWRWAPGSMRPSAK